MHLNILQSFQIKSVSSDGIIYSGDLDETDVNAFMEPCELLERYPSTFEFEDEVHDLSRPRYGSIFKFYLKDGSFKVIKNHDSYLNQGLFIAGGTLTLVRMRHRIFARAA